MIIGDVIASCVHIEKPFANRKDIVIGMNVENLLILADRTMMQLLLRITH
jgi:hypothetical protein